MKISLKRWLLAAAFCAAAFLGAGGRIACAFEPQASGELSDEGEVHSTSYFYCPKHL
jgi:hypothetical protein